MESTTQGAPLIISPSLGLGLIVKPQLSTGDTQGTRLQRRGVNEIKFISYMYQLT